MRCLRTLEDILEVMKEGPEERLFVRWTLDVELDLHNGTSRDELTGVELPGLSANSLAVEPWWGERSLRTWVARRLYDYGHLREQRGPGTRPCIFVGTECGRGPDNEPLICDCRVVAEIDAGVIEEANRVIADLPADWGSLRRI